MLNRRHKAVIFITLVLTGSILLTGARLNEGLGVLILGIALAWVLGSNQIIQIYQWLRNVPGRSWPWIRSSLFMALGGPLMVCVAPLSSFNGFVVAATLAIYGLVISGLWQLPTQKHWAKVVTWIVGAIAFFFATVGSMELSHLDTYAERLGELYFTSLIALSLGMFWLVKGWKLIVQGITFSPEAAREPELANVVKRGTGVSYASLLAGALLLTLWLGLLTFSASSDAVYPSQNTAANKENPSQIWSPVVFLMLLAFWPYRSWRTILLREPNINASRLKRHKALTIAVGAFFVIVLSLAATFGVQNGQDRRNVDSIEVEKKEFQSVAVRIGSIKGRNLTTTADYINAYDEIEPLLDDFDQRLSKLSANFHEAEREDQRRGLINIQRLYRNRQKQLFWDAKALELLREDSDITRKQVLVTKQMAALSEDGQVDLWNKNFLPLAQKEDELRQQIATLQKDNPLNSK